MIAPRNDGATWVKICGLRHRSDAEAAIAAGADALGVMFHDPSPRNASLDEGAAVAELGLEAGISVFVVTVGATVDRLRELVDRTGSSGVQLVGDNAAKVADVRAELPEVEILRACRVAPHSDAWPALSAGGADAILVDAYVPGLEGGTGQTLRWQAHEADAPLILAGGLNPANVADAIAAVNPFGVDVSSGVESGRGVKDPSLIKDFVKSVRASETAA